MTTVVEIASALGVGIAAGLGVAVPLGAIGVLLLREGVEQGVRRAIPAAIAVSCVDVMYCAAAILVGTVAAPTVNQLGAWPKVIGAVLLLIVAAVGIACGLRRSEQPTEPSRPSLSSSRFGLFFGLTAMNPATLVYFTAVAATLAHSLHSTTAIAVTAGVGLASLLWQSLLVWAGALLGSRATAYTRRFTVLVGNVVVAAFGAVMLVSATL
ncbi:LysE type translocator [Mycobacterium basiliense]|uniref:LysE type translocator n=1 Tax=Mycobacterium basiliense TaxID=2094119 RepID=A0A3S4BEA8_9MYCO|nr:LysE family transporter [Mycobacterium basiliense]VDM88794.1 LysE type translocator [Mycobacterium basiliense]